jgi:hypothetical protein
MAMLYQSAVSVYLDVLPNVIFWRLIFCYVWLSTNDVFELIAKAGIPRVVIRLKNDNFEFWRIPTFADSDPLFVSLGLCGRHSITYTKSLGQHSSNRFCAELLCIRTP